MTKVQKHIDLNSFYFRVYFVILILALLQEALEHPKSW